jgi:single-strand selective monofunctional uracil DNA glycosylase
VAPAIFVPIRFRMGIMLAWDMDLVAVSRRLCNAVEKLRFASPVEFVYNPLRYAREPHEAYLKRFGQHQRRVLLLGMNPGPFGMAQTGVPFGDVTQVSSFLGVDGRVTRPKREHPKRPVLGFQCPRREVSGSRLWGWAADRFGSSQTFNQTFFVHNYCPLAFLTASGANHTPDKLPRVERDALFELCDRALQQTVALLDTEWVIGVGKFAQARAESALAGDGIQIGTILHPSPASPQANRGWARIVEQQLADYGLLGPPHREATT